MDVGLTVEDSQKETCKQAASWVWYWIPFVGTGQLVLDLDKSLWPEKAGAWFFRRGADVDRSKQTPALVTQLSRACLVLL